MRSARDDGGSASGHPLLAVENLRTHIHANGRTVHAVDGVSFTVDRGETVCLVGESGSGKSVTCQSITGIVPRPPAEIVGGRVEYGGSRLDLGDEGLLRKFRGDRIGYIFQNPQHTLDPVYTVGEQIVEAIDIHEEVSASAARRRAADLLRRVGIPNPTSRLDDYPHQFSGGMAQRVAIAIALAADPDLLIADEPTTAVDVTVQARLVEQLRELTADGMALLLVTHDLRVVAAVADRVLVMFGGTIVERGPVEAIFDRPSHPYTQALFESHDRLTRLTARHTRHGLPRDGCRFRGVCSYAVDACAGPDQPPFHPVDGNDDHTVSCVHYGPGGDPSPIRDGAEAIGADGGAPNE